MRHRKSGRPTVGGSAALATALLPGLLLGIAPAGAADIVLSANDNHTTVVHGKPVGMKDPKPDNVSVIDLAENPPKILATIDVAFSDIGPPMAVAVAPDASFALVTSSTKPDPQSPDLAVPDDRISVIDLTQSPPQVAQVLHAGMGATTVRISPDGKIVLVANRMEGTISVFTLADRHLAPAGKLDLGAPKSLPAGLGFAHDGKLALVSRAGDHMVSVLHVDGTRLTLDPHPITTGYGPDTLDVNAAGTLAAVTNIGRADGDVDTVSLIDLTASPPRTIDTVAVPATPEGVRFAPDGKSLAVNSINGTVLDPGTPGYHENGILTLFAVAPMPEGGMATAGAMLRRVAAAPVGGWSQGVAFSRDGRTILVQNFRDHAIAVLRWENGQLTPGAPIAMPGGPAAIQTPWP